jgi:WD40 repeat protein/class 3 adenylate cyclase
MPEIRKSPLGPYHSPELSHINRLIGPEDWIARVEWAPDGRSLAAAHRGGVTVWNAETGTARFSKPIRSRHVFNASWSPHGDVIAVTDGERRLRFLDPHDGRTIRRLEVLPPAPAGDTEEEKANRHSLEDVRGFDWAPDGRRFVIGADVGVVVWDRMRLQPIIRLEGALRPISIQWSPNGRYIACSGYNSEICVWDADTGTLVKRLPATYGPALAWSPDSRRLASGQDAAINIWDVDKGLLSNVLEGHTMSVRALSFSRDGRLLASREGRVGQGPSRRRTLVWRTDTWESIASIREQSSWYLYAPLAFSPRMPQLAVGGAEDKVIDIWDTTELERGRGRAQTRTTFYRNAKVALLGDSGVGKSGLGLVLSGNQFAATESTHGRRIWVLETDKVKAGLNRYEIREVVLWDLAGQPGYRMIHQLHLDDVSLALILFDARNELDPFSGIRHWHRALQQTKRTSQQDAAEILVGARIDRGPVGVSSERIDSLLKELGLTAFQATSAKEGIGITALSDLIRTSINWDLVPSVSSNTLFQQIRKFLLKQKSKGVVLATTDELRRQYAEQHRLTRDRADSLRDEFVTCMSRLQALGLIRRFTFGNLVLLQPELLDSYASSIVFAAKDEPDGMGFIPEETVKLGKFRIPTEDRLKDTEAERLLLVATLEDLVRHEIAFREPSNDGLLLVFPSQLTRENPELPDPPGKFSDISFEGAPTNIYATLVVRLSHSGIFKKHEMWRNATTFKTHAGATCGVFLTTTEDGVGKVSIFFDQLANEEIRLQFEDFVHRHIIQRCIPSSVAKSRVVTCPDPTCSLPVSRTAVQKRRDRGFNWMDCNVCGTRISLDEPSEIVTVQETTALIERAATKRRNVETGLVSASGEMETRTFKQWLGATTGMLALVFTDLVGSTPLGLEIGEEQMSEIRRAHFGHAQKSIKSLDGYFIKTIGDSVMAAFRTANAALDFALSMHRDPGAPGLRLRAGIHVGPVEIDNEDAFGIMVNYAARVVSVPVDAEIWMSDRAHSDVMQRKAKKHTSLTWSEHKRELKGFSGEQTLWSVTYP